MITIWIRAVALCLWITAAHGQVKVYQVGRGGLSWTDQASVQTGAVESDGALQSLELTSGQNLIQLLRDSGLTWLKGQPPDFTAVGQPRAWSNDGLFNQINGPLRLVDGDPSSSSEGSFKSVRNQAGATFGFPSRPMPTLLKPPS